MKKIFLLIFSIFITILCFGCNNNNDEYLLETLYNNNDLSNIINNKDIPIEISYSEVTIAGLNIYSTNDEKIIKDYVDTIKTTKILKETPQDKLMKSTDTGQSVKLVMDNGNEIYINFEFCSSGFCIEINNKYYEINNDLRYKKLNETIKNSNN